MRLFCFSVFVCAKQTLATYSSVAGDAMEKIIKDQEEFEKEHQFMQVCISPCSLFFPEN